MDKEEHVNLEVEFNQYLQILRPYLGQLLNEEDVKICNAWIQKLSDCKEGEKNLRNKYIFSLCFQLAKGILSSPFNNFPPPEDLPMIYEKFNSDDSYSDVDTHIMYFKNSTSGKFLKNKQSSKSICQPNNSEITICSSKIERSDEIRDIKTFAPDFLSSSNSTIANCLQCPEIVKDIKNYIRSEDNVYLRVNNLVEKLREIKTQNTMLNKELELLKVKSEMKKSLDTPSSSKTLQIHCAMNTDSFINDNTELFHHCSCNAQLTELKEKFEELKESKRIELEELTSKYEKEIKQANTFVRIGVQEEYAKQIHDLTEKYESKIKELKQNADHEINQLKISLEALKLAKENSIATKNKIIDDFRTELDEIKAQNFVLRNKFIRANNNINMESIQEKSFQLERKLYKTEKSKNKRIKAYQIQLSNLQREKNLLSASMHLQLLKQRSELVLDLTEENQKVLTSKFEKLEEKYKEVVANVQAAAIQQKLQDQMSLDAIVKAVYDSDDNLNASSRYSRDEFQSEPIRIKQKNKNGPFSQVSCKRNAQMDKNVFNIEDNFVPAFCLDEVKLSELFERVYITRNKTADGQLNS